MSSRWTTPSESAESVNQAARHIVNRRAELRRELGGLFAAVRSRPSRSLLRKLRTQPSRVRHPPQSGWLDELGLLKGGRSNGYASRVARLLCDLKLSGVAIREFLFADVFANLLQFEANRGHRIAAGPEVLAGKVSLLAAHPGDGNSALPFQKADHRGDRMLRGYGDTDEHVVRHEMPFENLAFFLLGQGVERRTQLPADVSENGFPPSLGHKHHMVLAVPLRVG